MLSPLVAGVGAAGLISCVAARVGSSVVHSQRLLWVGLIVVGSMLLGAALYLWVRRSHRRELRADVLAAELLGGHGPGLVWLDSSQASAPRANGAFRCAVYTALPHPPPSAAGRIVQERNSPPARDAVALVGTRPRQGG